MDHDGGSTKGHAHQRSSNSTRRTRGRRRPLADQRFSNYLSFGMPVTICLVIFFVSYAIVLLGLSPLLSQQAPKVVPTHRGEVLRPVFTNRWRPMHIQEETQHLAHNVASAIHEKIQRFRQRQGVTDQVLLDKAVQDMNKLRNYRTQQMHKLQALQQEQQQQQAMLASSSLRNKKDRGGVVVLGMHRSGTSMLSGLMATGLGYKTGGPLIGSAFDNQKGFYELVPAVLQNDEFMNHQRIWWNSGVREYNSEQALDDKKAGRISFQEGAKALRVLNNPENRPWLQKDPRMCITLPTWLPLLNTEPAVLFTYRHPLEVAQSLKRRENSFTLEHGLRLWIVYNMRAVQNSHNLCRVTTSNEAILAHPLDEVTRVSHELTTKCRLPPPPQKLTQDDVDKFVDTTLQHNGAQQKAALEKRKVIETRNDGQCPIYEYDSDFSQEKNPNNFFNELEMYLRAMRIYCDFAVGKPYQEDYEWPELP